MPDFFFVNSVFEFPVRNQTRAPPHKHTEANRPSLTFPVCDGSLAVLSAACVANVRSRSFIGGSMDFVRNCRQFHDIVLAHGLRGARMLRCVFYHWQ